MAINTPFKKSAKYIVLCAFIVILQLRNRNMYSKENQVRKTEVADSFVRSQQTTTRQETFYEKTIPREIESQADMETIPPEHSQGEKRYYFSPKHRVTHDLVDKSFNSSCLLDQQQQKQRPVPVILMTLGRTGSSVTWQTLTNLTGFETHSDEYAGIRRSHIIKFYNNTVVEEGTGNGRWMAQYMCTVQGFFPDAYMVGFKWKPDYAAFPLPESLATLQLVVNYTAQVRASDATAAPPVRIIRQRRNPLDILLSRERHKRGRKKMGAHCKTGLTEEKRQECLTKQKMLMEIRNVTALYEGALTLLHEEDEVDRILEELQVPTVAVTYEGLYYPSSPDEGVKEWKKMFDYLGFDDPDHPLTWDSIQEAWGYLATSPRSHDEIISNIDEVRAKFEGSPIEHLLRISSSYEFTKHDEVVPGTSIRGEMLSQEGEKRYYFSPKHRVTHDLVDKSFNSSCLLDQQQQKQRPVPVILMTLGRTGSSVTWQTLTNLTGFETHSDEYAGIRRSHIIKFYNNTVVEEGTGNGRWMAQYMCTVQGFFPDAYMVGFKWKPDYAAFPLPESLATLQLVVNYTAQVRASDATAAPPVRIIRQRRNPLDILLSRERHKRGRKKMGAHCKTGLTEEKRQECLTKQKMLMEIRNVTALYEGALTLLHEEDEVDRILEELQVPTVAVTYEGLYYPSSPDEGVKEWKKMFDYLGFDDPDHPLTWDSIQEAWGYLATSPRSHDEIISNIDEVRAKFEGSPIEYLLRISASMNKQASSQ